MARIENSVFDAGPIIHISETNAEICYSLFSSIFITPEVESEIVSKDAPGKKELKNIINLSVITLDGKHKDMAKFMINKHGLDLGEASSISLCKQVSVSLFFTDDLDARIVAQKYGLNVHGTVGIIIRLFREGVLSKKNTINLLKLLREKSSLFVTSDLINWAINQVENYSK